MSKLRKSIQDLDKKVLKNQLKGKQIEDKFFKREEFL